MRRVSIRFLSLLLLLGAYGSTEANAQPVRPKSASVRPQVLHENSFTELFEKSKVHTVQVYVEGGNERTIGSGIVWTKDGYILTSAHLFFEESAPPVNDQGKKVKVMVLENVFLPARLIGIDRVMDVALMKVDDVSSLVPAVFGNSDTVRSGDFVYAVGFPLGLQKSVTMGIISGLGRRLGKGIQEAMQTDAALNPGNSGGPLHNIKGEVIGMNFAIASGANTVGFSIPINEVISVGAALRANGKVAYASLGASVADIEQITEAVAKLQGLSWPPPRKSGVLVVGVERNSSASRAGMERGDVVLLFGGRKIDESFAFLRLVAKSPVGISIPVVLFRNNKEIRIEVVLSERNGEASRRAEGFGSNQEGLRRLFGFALDALPEAVAREIASRQGMISEETTDHSGTTSYRSANAFLVNETHAVSVLVFVNSDPKVASALSYYFNGIPARLVFTNPVIGLALFRLREPYPYYKGEPMYADAGAVGAVHFSLVMRNFTAGDALPYQEVLKNKTVNGILVFTARIKPVGLGAPIFNEKGELVGMWRAIDKRPDNPFDVHDATYALPASVVKTFVDEAAKKLSGNVPSPQ